MNHKDISKHNTLGDGISGDMDDYVLKNFVDKEPFPGLQNLDVSDVNKV